MFVQFFFFFRRKKKKREELRKGETKWMISGLIFFFVLNTKECLQSRKWLYGIFITVFISWKIDSFCDIIS